MWNEHNPRDIRIRSFLSCIVWWLFWGDSSYLSNQFVSWFLILSWAWSSSLYPLFTLSSVIPNTEMWEWNILLMLNLFTCPPPTRKWTCFHWSFSRVKCATVFLVQSWKESRSSCICSSTEYSNLWIVPILALPTELKPPPPQSRRNTLSCLKGAEPSLLLSASTSDSISIIPSSEVASQLSSPAVGQGRSDTSGCHGRRGMMQAIKNEKRASKVRIKNRGELECVATDLRCTCFSSPRQVM